MESAIRPPPSADLPRPAVLPPSSSSGPSSPSTSTSTTTSSSSLSDIVAVLDQVEMMHIAAEGARQACEKARAEGAPELLAGCALLSLPVHLLQARLLRWLAAKDLRWFAETCQRARFLAGPVVPGFAGELYDHQRRALAWMEQRERASGAPGVPPDVDVFSRPLEPKTRGGLLCDDPGLGKTVTMLALCMRTKGLLPGLPPPKSAAATKKRASPGRERRDMEEAWLGSRPPAALTLVVVPKQLIEHWREQAGTHAPSLRVRVVETAADALGTFSEVDLVITSFARLSQESELGIRSPVLQVRWLRVVVDEGHAVAQGAQSNYKQLLSKLSCERKWAMTGTPAKLTSVPEGVGNLRRLLECIGIHPQALDVPRSARDGLARVTRVLAQFLMRFSKRNLRGLAQVVRTEAAIQLREDEKDDHDLLAHFVRANFVLTEIGDTGRNLSILSNTVAAREMVANFRLSCGVAGGRSFSLALTDKNHVDTMQLMRHEPEDAQTRVLDFIRAALGGQKMVCGVCGVGCALQLVTVCGHLVCPFCFDPHPAAAHFSCPTCGRAFDGDEFAGLQPGFSLVPRPLHVHSVGAAVAGAAVAGAAVAAAVVAGTCVDVGSKSQYILRRLAELGPGVKCVVYSQFAASANYVGTALLDVLGDDAVAQFWGKYRDSELHKFTTGQVKEWTCAVCQTVNKDAVIKSCSREFCKLRLLPGGQLADLELPPGVPRSHLAPGAHVAHSGTTAEVLTKPKRCWGKHHPGLEVARSVQCDVLLLYKDGTVGLNLLDVQVVFLVDPVWDAAAEEQVIARAWRMNNRHPSITIEQLYCRGTVEEMMVGSHKRAFQEQRTTQAAFVLKSLKRIG